MAMKRTTAGQLLVNSALPEDLRDDTRELDKTNVRELLRKVAKEYPDQYAEISHKLNKIGEVASTRTGGLGFTIEHLQKSREARVIQQELKQQIQAILSNPKLSEQQRNDQIVVATQKIMPLQKKRVYEAAIAAGNPLALQALSGVRGSDTNFNTLVGGDLLYTDHRDRVIPIPVTRSYGEGLTPAEYWAGAYGARKGVSDLKIGTAKAGYWKKLLTQAVHRLVVTAEDHETPPDTLRGLPVDVDDPDNEGAVLAHDVGGYSRGEIIDTDMLEDLKRQKISRMLVRSPILQGPADGGLYAVDAGIRASGRLPERAEFPGMTAADAIGEPVSQNTISSKHCLWAETLVRMADGSVRKIRDIRAGDWVLGADAQGNAFPVRVLNHFHNGLRDCIRAKFRVGYSEDFVYLEATADHQILAEMTVWGPPKSTTQGKIRLGERLGKSRTFFNAKMVQQVTLQGGRTEPFAFLTGLLLGDGCYTRSVNGIFLSCYDPSLIEEIQPLLRPMNLEARKRKGSVGDYRISMLADSGAPRCGNSGRYVPHGCRNPIKSFLTDRGMYAKYAHEKCLPPDVANWDQQSCFALLSGLFVSDGSIYISECNRKNKGAFYIAFGCTSRQMTEEIRSLIQKCLGIIPGPISQTATTRKRPLHQFVISRWEDVTEFTRKVPLYGIKKRVAESLLSARLASAKSAHRFYRDPVVDDLGPLETMDLEVDHPDHLFVLANGLIVSNSGGVAGQGKTTSGFQLLQRMTQAPKIFPGAAAHAQRDGQVTAVEPTPTGGHFVIVDGEKHFVSRGFPVRVKPGDRVTAGDQLSDGWPNPGEVVKHYGIGEGRQRYTAALLSALKDAGVNANRRNVEMLARGLINHVRVTREFQGYDADDVVPYDTVASQWEPREDSKELPLETSQGQYLEKPYLHYSIGTRITPAVRNSLKEFNVSKVWTNAEPPPFAPEMVRASDNLQHDPDWMTRLYGSGVRKGLMHAAQRGATSDRTGTSFVPSLAYGPLFGREGAIQRRPSTVPISALPKPVELTQTKAANIQADIRQAAKATEEPTPAQIESGNYKKGKFRLHGMTIAIETPKGTYRRGVDPSGKAWSVRMRHHYGYIHKTTGRDEDHVDVFLGDQPESELIFVVDQLQPDGKRFDEHKVMIGFTSEADAKDAYLQNYEDGWKGLGGITGLTVPQFRRWLQEGDQRKPVAATKIKAAAVQPQSPPGKSPTTPSLIELLRAAKASSDRGEYAEKHRIVRQAVQRDPASFREDSRQGGISGLTHASGFRLHVPRSVLGGLSFPVEGVAKSAMAPLVPPAKPPSFPLGPTIPTSPARPMPGAPPVRTAPAPTPQGISQADSARRWDNWRTPQNASTPGTFRRIGNVVSGQMGTIGYGAVQPLAQLGQWTGLTPGAGDYVADMTRAAWNQGFEGNTGLPWGVNEDYNRAVGWQQATTQNAAEQPNAGIMDGVTNVAAQVAPAVLDDVPLMFGSVVNIPGIAGSAAYKAIGNAVTNLSPRAKSLLGWGQFGAQMAAPSLVSQPSEQDSAIQNPLPASAAPAAPVASPTQAAPPPPESIEASPSAPDIPGPSTPAPSQAESNAFSAPPPGPWLNALAGISPEFLQSLLGAGPLGMALVAALSNPEQGMGALQSLLGASRRSG